MDTAQWAQGIGVVKPMESSRSAVLERKTRPPKDQALNCPRCNSTNTKFCYYNNYSLCQPRYFCKTCRRYWTEGGSLRNVPVGGGSRKNKRGSASSAAAAANSTAPSPKKLSSTTDQLTVPVFLSQSAPQSSKIRTNQQDLNLACPPVDHQDYNALSKFVDVPYGSTDDKSQFQNPNSSSVSSHQSQLTSMDLLKNGIASRGLGSFMGLPASDQSSTMYSDGYSLQDFKPSLNFSLEGFENGYGSLQGMQEGTGARLLFPVEELNKQVDDSTGFGQNRSQAADQASGYWNGMLGGPW